eukprot:14303-Pelagococcus_subviridis.AAC.3
MSFFVHRCPGSISPIERTADDAFTFCEFVAAPRRFFGTRGRAITSHSLARPRRRRARSRKNLNPTLIYVVL